MRVIQTGLGVFCCAPHATPPPTPPFPFFSFLFFCCLTFTMSPGHRCTFGHRVGPPEQPALIILLEGVVGRGVGLTPSVRAAGGTRAQVAAAAAVAAPPGRLTEDGLISPFVPLDSLSSPTSFARSLKAFQIVRRLTRRFNRMILRETARVNHRASACVCVSIQCELIIA